MPSIGAKGENPTCRETEYWTRLDKGQARRSSADRGPVDLPDRSRLPRLADLRPLPLAATCLIVDFALVFSLDVNDFIKSAMIARMPRATAAA